MCDVSERSLYPLLFSQDLQPEILFFLRGLRLEDFADRRIRGRGWGECIEGLAALGAAFFRKAVERVPAFAAAVWILAGQNMGARNFADGAAGEGDEQDNDAIRD